MDIPTQSCLLYDVSIIAAAIDGVAGFHTGYFLLGRWGGTRVLKEIVHP